MLHTGQPLPAVRDLTTACHSCPFLHSHQTSLWLPGEHLVRGERGVFRGVPLESHLRKAVAKSVWPGTASFPEQ